MTPTIIILSGLTVAGSFVAGERARRIKGLTPLHKQIICDIVGVTLALSLLVFVEATLHYAQGTSFFDLVRSGRWGDVVLPVLISGAVQGIIYEYIGHMTFPFWYYPQIERLRFLLLFLPLFWAIFMVILQDSWALFRGAGLDPWLAVGLVAFVHLSIIEGINLFIHSWVYKGWVNTIYALAPGWILLVLTFVVLQNRYFVNPFGY